MTTTWPHTLRTGVLLMLLALASCAAPSRRPAVPAELSDRAAVLHNPAVRTWAGEYNEPFLEEMMRASTREIERLRAAGDHATLPPANYLAISGGGANGAYGAGLLCGWTAAGTRPEFKVVTGISTGALTAPFAFLGPAYDDKLRQVYTTVRTKQIALPRGILAAIFDDALMNTDPLRKLLNQLVDEQMMRDIAREYERGRLLMVGTTNLDANRGVIWNIGAIAASGDPKGLDLIRDILIASAAIPAAFPPVMIDVEADGKPYQEMHVDGGAKAQVFLYPPTFRLRASAEAEGITRERRVYIIRNSRLDAQWADVERLTLSIAGRAIESLIQTQGVGDLYRIYTVTRRDDVEFNLAFIPATFNVKSREDFDPVYMSQLFDVAYRAATRPDGYPWERTPPGLTELDQPPGPAPAK